MKMKGAVVGGEMQLFNGVLHFRFESANILALALQVISSGRVPFS